MATLEAKLVALATMSPVQLRIEWGRLYGSAAPAISPDLLTHGIAFRLQERALRPRLMPMARLLSRSLPHRSNPAPGCCAAGTDATWR